VSSTYLPLLSGARPQTPSAQLRTSLLLLHPFIPPLSDPTRVRRVSPWRSWRRSCDLATWMDPSFGSRMPPDDLSRSERRARVDEWPTACESVRGHPPPPRLVHAGTMSSGLGSSRPWTFSPLTSLGQVGRNATRRGRLEGCRDHGRGRPNPGSRPKPGNLRSLGKRPHLLEPLPPSKLRTEQWADRPMPAQRTKLCPCFLPVNSVDGCERLIPACRQEIGYFSLHLAPLPACPPH
jgi:hypothetical protein